MAQALWDEPNSQLPVLEMVTEENLKYDIHDMDNAVENKGSFACVYKPVEVQRWAMPLLRVAEWPIRLGICPGSELQFAARGWLSKNVHSPPG